MNLREARPYLFGWQVFVYRWVYDFWYTLLCTALLLTAAGFTALLFYLMYLDCK